MPATLNVVALISGGKDSLYSLLHCVNNGHNVVALANLYPPPRGPSTSDNVSRSDGGPGTGAESEHDDLDSYMYQTVGHSVIPLYAEALGLPLFRQMITGSAIQMGRYYDSSSITSSTMDETEDLIPLLTEIMRHHPEVNAISSGAILSTYQRTRIESIALRLGLTPLAYLWQYPALPPPCGRVDTLTGLLDDMADAGCDSRIIKIASGGIKERLLWSDVADPRTKTSLVSGMAPFFPGQELWLRGAILGEGGEYETLAIEGPAPVWKKRIEIREEYNTVKHAEGGASYMLLPKPGLAELQEKASRNKSSGLVRIPPQLDRRFETMRRNVSDFASIVSATGGVDDKISLKTSLLQGTAPAFVYSHSLSATHLTISNIMPKSRDLESDAACQMQSVMEQVSTILEYVKRSHGLQPPLTTSNIVFSFISLASMVDFASVNAVYSTMFRGGEPNPPARVTIACELPELVRVSISVVFSLKSRSLHRGLHVQSRSYWAPANIGPYSQAICVPLYSPASEHSDIHDAGLVEAVHVAGQIPLVPHTMELAEGCFQDQATLSLQHLWRVGQERGVDLWPWGVAFLGKASQVNAKADVAAKVWRQVHLYVRQEGAKAAQDDDEDTDSGPDLWDLQHNRSGIYQSTQVTTVGEHLHALPNYTVLPISASNASPISPFIAVEVPSLPRNATIEWWSLGLANLPQGPSVKPRLTTASQLWPWGISNRITISFPEEQRQDGNGKACSEDKETQLITIMLGDAKSRPTYDMPSADEMISMAIGSDQHPSTIDSSYQIVHGTAFVAKSDGWETWSSIANGKHLDGVTLVPCQRVWGRQFEAQVPAEEVQDTSKVDEFANTGCSTLSLAIILRLEITAGHA